MYGLPAVDHVSLMMLPPTLMVEAPAIRAGRATASRARTISAARSARRRMERSTAHLQKLPIYGELGPSVRSRGGSTHDRESRELLRVRGAPNARRELYARC